ncbi:MAG: hypothetical protein HND44_20000 [Chloroflexi bacterium]|nr:hypothetical protein [Ardenticatenaceae bacterium]NOG36828.1 hypothetical protein [Chloroflexota bacterium]
MQLQEIRNQMWVVVNGQPVRRAKDNEVKRWAVLRLIEMLKNDKITSCPTPRPAKPAFS